MTTPPPGPPSSEDEDAREHDAFAQTQDPLDLQAATWLTRQQAGLSPQAQAELRDWLAADPRHQAAYDDMAATFGRLRGLPGPEVASLRAGLPPPPAFQPSSAPPAPPRPRRAWLTPVLRWLPQAAAAGAACAMLALAWLGWRHWQSQPVFERTYAAARGQLLHADLPDGSHLTLDTATQAHVRLYRHRREVQLSQGQALFSVSASAQQPFDVLAGPLRVSVTGTRFAVRHTPTGLGAGRTRVAVEEGQVRVAPQDAPTGAGGPPLARAITLNAGQSIETSPQGQLPAAASATPGSAAPWREGRVSFEHTPLAQALAEFERYGPTGVRVRDPAIAALPVGGSFELRRLDAFLNALPRQLPVRLQRQGGQIEISAARPRGAPATAPTTAPAR